MYVWAHAPCIHTCEYTHTHTQNIEVRCNVMYVCAHTRGTPMSVLGDCVALPGPVLLINASFASFVIVITSGSAFWICVQPCYSTRFDAPSVVFLICAAMHSTWSFFYMCCNALYVCSFVRNACLLCTVMQRTVCGRGRMVDCRRRLLTYPPHPWRR